MNKLLILAMLFTAPAFASSDCCKPKSQERVVKKIQEKKKKQLKKERHKKVKKGYKQWRKSEKKGCAVSTVYWSPDRAINHDVRVKRDSSGNRVDTSCLV
jgi:hypothetical protein